jgi:hypothetical protein
MPVKNYPAFAKPELPTLTEADYQAFLRSKAQHGSDSGFEPLWMPDFLFDFQKYGVERSLQKGRSALLEDCGMGKTPQHLVWSENVIRHTNGNVLTLCPLAVAKQTVREGEKFGIEVHRSNDGRALRGINVTNYEKLHHFNPADFAGVVCDESSILKSFNGKRKAEITEFMRTIPYRLLCTATAAPNDYVELGTSSEALGELGYMDMLNRFFRNQQNTVDTKGHWKGHAAPRAYESPHWRFKGHAEAPFFRWVCSWALAGRKPSDLGNFSDDRFRLTNLIETEYIVETRTLGDGMLFPLPAANMREERDERRRTVEERCEKAAELVACTGQPAVIWCHLNAEGKLLGELVQDGKEISGSDSEDEKEEAYEAFSKGQLRVLITKPKIGAWGLNWQHCAHVVSFASHSYEQYYQAVRRCWRFGQTHDVRSDLIATEGERGAKENMKRKSTTADRMFSLMVENMQHANRLTNQNGFNQLTEVPAWL